MKYTVIVCDMFHYTEPDHEIEVPGFPTQEVAIEYARRRLRRSLEELRRPEQTPEELRSLWYTFGEDCRVIGPGGVVYRASSELERFINNPIPLEACDYLSLYHALLPEDFALTCDWAAGAMPPPYHYEYSITVGPDGRGEITFWPDYPAEETPAWRETWQAPFERRLRLYHLLEEHGFLNPVVETGEEEERPIGGETVRLEASANGQRIQLDSTRLSADRADALREMLDAVRALVPDLVWEDLAARRRAYIERVYPGDG